MLNNSELSKALLSRRESCFLAPKLQVRSDYIVLSDDTEMILRVDDIIRAAPRKRQDPGM